MRSARGLRLSRAIDEVGLAKSCRPRVQARHQPKMPGFWSVFARASVELSSICGVPLDVSDSTGHGLRCQRRSGPPLAPFFHKTWEAFMAEPLRNKRIAALVDDGFEESELLEPKRALEA